MYHLWGRGELHTVFWWGTLEEKDHLEDLGLDGKVILKLIFKKWRSEGGMDRIHQAQDRGR